MPRRRSLRSQLFRVAGVADDVEAVASGRRRRIGREAKNAPLAA